MNRYDKTCLISFSFLKAHFVIGGLLLFYPYNGEQVLFF
jgi:hypothetical protein